jgi:transcriptional regulator with XRE-family HTH domain
MISGEQIRTARDAAGMTQQELATQLGVTQRTVGNWERGENIPRNREPLLRRILAAHLEGGAPPSPMLERATDMELLAEVARRMARAEAKSKPETPG